MDDPLERLRKANPIPRSECLPIDRVWEKIDGAGVGARPVVRRARRRKAALRGRVGDWIALFLAVAVSLSVVAVVVLSAGSPARTVPASKAVVTVCGSSALGGGSGQQVHIAGPPDPLILKEVAVLRQPAGGHDESLAACQASVMLPSDPQYVMRADPAYVRYAGPGVLGGQVFVYALPGVPRAIAYKGMPSDSTLAHIETQPSVCLLTLGGPPASLGGCTNLQALQSAIAGFGAAQIPGTSTSTMGGVVRDGITAVAVYDHDKRIMTVPVHNNVVQFIVDHNAPAAVYLKLVYLAANGRPAGAQ